MTERRINQDGQKARVFPLAWIGGVTAFTLGLLLGGDLMAYSAPSEFRLILPATLIVPSLLWWVLVDLLHWPEVVRTLTFGAALVGFGIPVSLAPFTPWSTYEMGWLTVVAGILAGLGAHGVVVGFRQIRKTGDQAL